MDFSINFNEEKNQLLKATRGVSFEEVIEAVRNEKVLADINNPSNQRPHQKAYVIEIQGYAYVIPYLLDPQKKEIFLKTIYPSRVFTRKYFSKGKDENEKSNKE